MAEDRREVRRQHAHGVQADLAQVDRREVAVQQPHALAAQPRHELRELPPPRRAAAAGAHRRRHALAPQQRDPAHSCGRRRVVDRVGIERVDVRVRAEAQTRVMREVLADEEHALRPLEERLLDRLLPRAAAGGAEREPLAAAQRHRSRDERDGMRAVGGGRVDARHAAAERGDVRV